MATYDIYKKYRAPYSTARETIGSNAATIYIYEWDRNEVPLESFDFSKLEHTYKDLPHGEQGSRRYFKMSTIPDQSIYSANPTYVVFSWVPGHNVGMGGYVGGTSVHWGQYVGTPDDIAFTYSVVDDCYILVTDEKNTIYLRYGSEFQPISVIYPFEEYKNYFPVNFYRTKNGEYTNDPIILNRGENSGRLTFDIVFEDGAVPYSGRVIFEPSDDPDFTIVEPNSITASETATRYISHITAKPELYADSGVFTLIELQIPDNLGPYGPGGISKPEGGDGSFSDGDSEDIRGDVPNGSKESNSSSTGLFTRYAMSSSDLYVVGAALYTENILASIGKEIMSFLWNSPSDALISLISYPFDVGSLISTTSTSVKFGSLTLEAVTGARLNGTFAQIDWGSIQLEEFWGNFLDYAPHTKIDLYLPWCTGFVSIDPHECLPGSISVVTNIEISKGTCVHNVFGNKGALIGTFSGTCGSQLPMTALDTSGKALALVTAAAGAIVAGAAAGGATSAGIAAANDVHAWGPYQKQAISRGLEYRAAHLWAVDKAADAAEAPYRAVKQRASQAALVSAAAAFRTPASVQRSGSFSGNGAGMGIQYPFIIISRPEQNVPENYGRFYGYPSNVYTSLGSVRGYTEVGSVHVNGLSGSTLEEIEEIENLLHGGVIL